MEQALLLIHPVLMKDFNGLVRGYVPLHDRKLCLHIFGHLRFDPVYQLLVFGKVPVRFNKKAIGNGILHGDLPDVFCPCYLIKRF